MRRVAGDGPQPARIMIVGEAPGEQEEYFGKPFVGASGQELDKMLHETGWGRKECYVTNVCQYRPTCDEDPKKNNDIDLFFLNKTEAKAGNLGEWWGKYPNELIVEGIIQLELDVAAVQPDIIIAFGNTALWALTGLWGVGSWRGSVLLSRKIGGRTYKVIPTYHPAAVLRVWEWRPIVIHDLRRAKKESAYPHIVQPAWRFVVAPTYDQVEATLNMLLAKADAGPLPLVCDVETRGNLFMDCVGLAWNKLDAICIPWMRKHQLDPNYWSDVETEMKLVLLLRKLLKHPNVKTIGQNFIYDAQFFAHHWGYCPNIGDDTMLMQHVNFLGMQKSLDFIASMYCEHYWYWKEDRKDVDDTVPDEKRWIYNCTDCVRTFEVWEELQKVTAKMQNQKQYAFVMRLWPAVFRMMIRGVKMNTFKRSEFMQECIGAMADRQSMLERVLGHELNTGSPKQMMQLFYGDFGFKPVKHKTTKKPTTNDDALKELALFEPIIKPITEAVSEMRSLGQSIGVLKTKLDRDARIRCSFNIGGTETLRFSSSESAFGTGTNLQNVSQGDRNDTIDLPNIRKLMVPDRGMVLCDVDLAGADAQVVAWEAGDEQLKAAFRAGLKVHVVNAKALFGEERMGEDGKAEPYYTRTKVGVHLTNYGGKAYTCAKALGIPRNQAEAFQSKWFGLHPAIPAWHRRVERELQTTRMVVNKFGFKRLYLGRPENSLTEALAWGPQSTVAIVINHGLARIYEEFPEVELLLQVHDSLVFQIPAYLFPKALPRIRELLLVTIPYADPLVIQCGLKVSWNSWGEVKQLTGPNIDRNGWPILQ